MLEVGIDWGQKSPNAFAILAENGKIVKKGSVQRSAEGAQQIIEQIKELETDPQQVRIGIDRKNDILPHILCSEGYVVYPLNPLSADRARDIYYPAGNKDDRVDAEVHARMVRNSWRNLRALRLDDDKDREIRSLLRNRNNLVDMRAQNKQRLGSVLAEASPNISGLCENLRLQWVKDFLRKWPLGQDFAEVHGNTLNAFLRKHPRISEATKRQICSVHKQPCCQHQPRSAECYRLEIHTLLQLIASLQQQIEVLEEKIKDLAAEHPDKAIFSSLPTDSDNTVAAFCTAFGPDRDEPYGWRNYSAYYGMSPITEESGKNKQVKMRLAYEKTIHKALLDFADSMRRQEDCWAYDYYKRKKQEGKGHYHALRCLGTRWVKILHAMWRNRTQYDEAFHRRNRAARGAGAA